MPLIKDLDVDSYMHLIITIKVRLQEPDEFFPGSASPLLVNLSLRLQVDKSPMSHELAEETIPPSFAASAKNA